MIKYKDFEIKTTAPESWMMNPKFERIEETLLRLNSWIEENEALVPQELNI